MAEAQKTGSDTEAADPTPQSAVPLSENASPQQLATAASVLDVSQLVYVRKTLRRSMTANLVLAGLSFALGLSLYVLKTNEVKREFFAYDGRTGQMVQLQPLNRPNMTTSALLDWTMRCVEEAHSYDVVNYRRQLTDVAGRCFTVDGWNEFYQALERSGNLKSVIDSKMIASAVRNGPAVIVQQGVNPASGSYSYIVRFPMTVTYQGQGRMPTQNLTMTVQVARVDPSISPDGVGIEQVIGK